MPMSDTQTSEAAVRSVAEHLAERGVRFTRARRLVVEALDAAGGPRTAAELHDRLRPVVPLSSLYRTLTVLEDAGVVSREHDVEGVARHELAEWLAGHHHHLVCTECGAVVDIDIPASVERRLGSLVEEIAEQAGFAATGHRIDVEGRCPSCRHA
jgi:Fur family ferric uptake transcriptional regulator